MAETPRLTFDSQPLGESLHRVCMATVADQHEIEIQSARAAKRGGIQENVGTLVQLSQAADESNMHRLIEIDSPMSFLQDRSGSKRVIH